MSTNSATNIWPTAPILITDSSRELITRFFDIADSTDPKSGRLMADELFAEDAVFQTHETLIIRGRAEIGAARENNQPEIVKRSHELVQVWAADSPATDIAVHGRFGLILQDGQTVTDDFIARFQIVEDGLGRPRFKAVRVWTDPAKMMEALDRCKKRES